MNIQAKREEISGGNHILGSNQITVFMQKKSMAWCERLCRISGLYSHNGKGKFAQPEIELKRVRGTRGAPESLLSAEDGGKRRGDRGEE